MPRICPDCGGDGCHGCDKRGWLLTDNDRAEMYEELAKRLKAEKDALTERHEAQTAVLREVEAERDALRARLDAQATPAGKCPACEVAYARLSALVDRTEVLLDPDGGCTVGYYARQALAAMDAAGPCRSPWRVVVRRSDFLYPYEARLLGPAGDSLLGGYYADTAAGVVEQVVLSFGVTPADIEVEGEVAP